MDTITHGTSSGYNHHRCRCEACKGYRHALDARRRDRLVADPNDPAHGKVSGYSMGCRCEPCSAARRVYMAERHSRLGAAHRNRRTRYGLTPEAYTAMLDAQDGRCASCGDGLDAAIPHIDHDHGTGAVRAILCAGCNVALGRLQDDSGRVAKLLEYIRRFDA
jgi:hypothetical protein